MEEELSWDLCIPLSPSHLFLALPHCKQIQGAWEEPQAPAHCLTYQSPLNHIRGEFVVCAHQQRPYGCLVVGIKLCGAVGTGGAASSMGVEEGVNPMERLSVRAQKHCHRTSSRHRASTTFVYLWNSIPHATCSDVTKTSVSNTTGGLFTHPLCPASWDTP